MKTIIRHIAFAVAGLLLAIGGAACDNSNIADPQEPQRGETLRPEAGIAIQGAADGDAAEETLLISDAGLKYYDLATAELKFCSQAAAEGIENCDRVTFARDGQPLFEVEVVVGQNAAVAGTLYVESAGSYSRSYYLYGDGSDGWKTFLDCLSTTGRLVSSQPEPGPAPEPNPGTPADPAPYVPQSPVAVGDGLELVRLTPEAAWCTGLMEENRLAVIRSDEELSAWVGLSDVTTAIDYTRHTLLAVRVYTPNLVERISCALNPTDDGFRYSLRVRMNCCDAIGDELLLMLAPALSAGVPVALDFSYDYEVYEVE